ncbi:stage VI sporulation protein D [Neobacillus sp. PS3-40]|uniref:stage VI sporulation protein D n=1 Tax=Neobacillus sp. PS3-40 TaxID=3070679 RepID=UPI0027E1193A|nr:stage VI sporulation protein D [Neobacillus sp. PS3-40]WML45567.1 stage VI sporulation protein D [Neobacillus sp. PS3-40]
MSQENQSFLRFSLEESLWFRKGQEVAELVSISLDPDITIQENDQYVNIRGSLELTGEYNSTNENQADEEENVTTQKYIQSVEERDGGLCEFSHRFPVDITIPNNRIQSIYDIDVLVESFDYAIPERSCLKLSAELTISGLYGVQQNETVEDSTLEVMYRDNEEDVNEANQDLLFEAEARKQPEEENVEVPLSFPTFSYQETDIDPENQKSTIPHEEPRKKVKKQIEVIEQELIVEEPIQEPIIEEVIIVEESSSSSSSSEESPLKKEMKKKKTSKSKSMSLTEFFARKEGEDDQAKLKICIVQKGDNLDRVAERYNVTIQNLLRVNQLEINQDVSEGQVLYIPAALTKK